MGSLHLDDLSIRGFRGIRDLHISNLGRVTLITGRNNTGKSSVLEALRLYASNASRSSIVDILNYREEYRRWDYEESYPTEVETVLLVSPLFHGFPQHLESFEPITISATGESGGMKLAINVAWAIEELGVLGRRNLIATRPLLPGVSTGVIAIHLETEVHSTLRLLEDFLLRPQIRRREYSSSERPGKRMPCMSVSPHGKETTGELGSLWDSTALTDLEQEVVEALRIIDHSISAVSMVGSEPFLRARLAVVHARNISRPVPLRTFGDGANRVFALALALVNARGGLLLIDEFENGLHHSVQTDVWRMIFRLAERLDVQVFATTHSRDSVRSFQEAAAESPEEGVLLRLTRKGDDIVPTVANEEELSVATRHDIEVR